MGDVLVALAGVLSHHDATAGLGVVLEPVLEGLDGLIGAAAGEEGKKGEQVDRLVINDASVGTTHQHQATVLLEVITDLSTTLPSPTSHHFLPLMVRILPLLTSSIRPPSSSTSSSIKADSSYIISTSSTIHSHKMNAALFRALSSLCQAVAVASSSSSPSSPSSEAERVGPQGEKMSEQLVGTALEVLLTGNTSNSSTTSTSIKLDGGGKDGSGSSNNWMVTKGNQDVGVVRGYALEALGYMAGVVTMERLQHHAQVNEG